MDKETYDGYRAQLKRGEMVIIKGRTALNEDHLDFALRASGQSVPGKPGPDAHDPLEVALEGLTDALENQQLEQLQDLAVSLGLTITGDETAGELHGPIREAQADLQKK